MSTRRTNWLGIPERAVPVVRAGFLLGVGLGGFFDGIVFHQILQVHHMLSATTDPNTVGDLRLNVLADGFFHAFTYVCTAVGVGLLWRAEGADGVHASGETLLGSLVMGWGAFNAIEGLVDHQVPQIQHVWPGGPGGGVWDLAFLVCGCLWLWVLAGSTGMIERESGNVDPRATRRRPAAFDWPAPWDRRRPGRTAGSRR